MSCTAPTSLSQIGLSPIRCSSSQNLCAKMDNLGLLRCGRPLSGYVRINWGEPR